jgi:ABC-type transport system substrate-binding protein
MALAAIVIVVVIIASAGVYFGFSGRGGQSTSNTSTAQKRTSLTVDELTQPDTLDPAVTYETSGWEPVQQVYQTLITYDRSSFTTYVGVLAKSWSVSSSMMNYTFQLRQGVTFSNGDPFNAYVEWYSIYRTILVNQAPAWILGQNLAAGNPPHFNVTDSMLNSMNYFSPSAANLTVMMHPGQSVQVVNASAIQFNLGYGYNGNAPYSAFLSTLVTPMADAVDPAFVKSHGGVVANTKNDQMTTQAIGTGSYELQSWVVGQSVTLTKNPNYWANSLPKSQLNYAIAPAILNSVVFYYKDSATSIADIRSGTAQMISVPVTYYNVTKAITGVNTSILSVLYGASEDVHYIYMDPQAFAPFSDINVRKAITSAIDYGSIIRLAFGGNARQWVGPVPPTWQFYNESTAGLTPYQHDAIKAAALLAQAGYVSHLPNGTTLNSGGKVFPSVDFLYDSDNPTDAQAAQIVQSNLASVGITIQLKSLPFRQYANVLALKGSTNATYAMGFGYYSEDYTASVDYVSYFTTSDQVGSSAYMDAKAVAWTTQAATSSDRATIISAFQQITQRMYQNSTDIWMYVPELMAVKQNGITGVIPNPAGSGMGYFLYYNTINFTG